MQELKVGQLEPIELTEENKRELEQAELEARTRWINRAKFLDLNHGVPLVAKETVRYHPQIRPIIKHLEEQNPDGFLNAIIGTFCTITWVGKCQVQINQDHIYVWKDKVHRTFCVSHEAYGAGRFELITDFIALSQEVIKAIKSLSDYLFRFGLSSFCLSLDLSAGLLRRLVGRPGS